ncbi:MAG TPA: hypothetical protein VMU89_24395 [Thermomicrobiaceae bacterium]|nr:hypothetical protein [Thermomicrobiaceae bacterium]
MTVLRRLSAWLKVAAREHWLSLLILAVPINWVVYQSDTAENILPMLPLPLVAFAIGLTLRPRHVWLLWLGSVVIEWLVVGYMGKYSEPGGGETVRSIVIEAFPWMALGVLVPVWLGRFLGSGLREGRHSDATPKEPAS